MVRDDENGVVKRINKWRKKRLREFQKDYHENINEEQKAVIVQQHKLRKLEQLEVEMINRLKNS